MSQKTDRHPERHMGTRCGSMVEKGHVGYPCSRPQGHTSVPSHDPEPCYAVEVPASLRRWQAWSIRQEQAAIDSVPGDNLLPDVLDDDKEFGPAEQLAAVHAPRLVEPPQERQDEFHLAQIRSKHCPDQYAHEPHLYQPEDSVGVDNYCDGTGLDPFSVEAAQKDWPEWLEVVGRPWPSVAQLRDLKEAYRINADSANVPEEQKPLRIRFVGGLEQPVRILPSKAWAEAQSVPSPLSGEPVSPAVAAADEAERRTYEAVDPGVSERVMREFADCGTVCWEAHVHTPSDPHCVMAPSEPTKQREGDQILPTGSTEIADDQSLVIADIEARRQVGIARYGQAHVPFNGRNTMLDAYEETLDFLVYQRSLLRLRETTKAEVTDIVAKVIRENEGDPFGYAEAIMDRIADWALMQRLGDDYLYAYSGALRANRVPLEATSRYLIEEIQSLADRYGLLGVLSTVDAMFEKAASEAGAKTG